MYHRVMDTDYGPRHLCVSRSQFDEHLQVIKKYGDPIQMQEMERNVRKFSLGRKEIVISLDDGSVDHFNYARPALEKYEMPATFFIISGAVGCREEYYVNDLHRIIETPEILPEAFALSIGGIEYHWRVEAKGLGEENDDYQYGQCVPPNNVLLSRAGLYSALIRLLSPMSSEGRKSVIQMAAGWSGQSITPRPDYLAMSSEQVVSLARSPLFEIGAHTVSHPRLSCLSVERQREEIGRSKKDLEDLLNRPVMSFSYPFGDYSEETVRLVSSAKFQAACTVVPQPVRRHTSPFLLPRFAISNWNGDEFEQNLRQWLMQ